MGSWFIKVVINYLEPKNIHFSLVRFNKTTLLSFFWSTNMSASKMHPNSKNVSVNVQIWVKNVA